MKKTKMIGMLIIGAIIGSFVGIKASTLISSSQIIYKDNKTVDVALSELFAELKKGKDKVAEAITNKGVETPADNTLEEMASNISLIENGSVIKYLGTGTSFDIKKVATELGINYSNLTNDNFIVSVISAPSTSTEYTTWINYHIASTSGFTVGKAYNSSTGILTISGTTQTVKCTSQAGPNFTILATQTLNVGVWLIIE